MDIKLIIMKLIKKFINFIMKIFKINKKTASFEEIKNNKVNVVSIKRKYNGFGRYTKAPAIM